jgi:iron complex outermembrane receptor protein
MGNAGEAHTKGVELGVGIKPLPWLTARPTYTFTDATIAKNPLVPATVGRRVPLVARHAAAMTLSAVQPRWSATVTGRYQGDVFSTDTNTDIVNGVPGSYDPFFEADVAVSVTAAKAATVLLTVENILDRRYFMFYRNPGRMVHLGLRLRF